ncbi:MAG: peptide chain release factor N(5)-glutamine methyltransferase, partial [Desulforhopalus sp.]
NLSDLVFFVQASLLSGFRDCHQFSLVVSNPPYVSRDELADQLAPEVSHHEPHLALDGGERGMEVIALIRRALPPVLAIGAQCFLEIGADQGDEVLELFRKEMVGQRNFQQVEILRDYAGRDRVVHARMAK